MRLLRMRAIYIEWSKKGTKTATTRLKYKGTGHHELISGSYYKPVKSGVIIEIWKVQIYTRKDISNSDFYWIAKLEGFNSGKEFWDVLKEINGEKLTENTLLYTHYYRIKEAMK